MSIRNCGTERCRWELITNDKLILEIKNLFLLIKFEQFIKPPNIGLLSHLEIVKDVTKKILRRNLINTR